jgi:hypothetical protein
MVTHGHVLDSIGRRLAPKYPADGAGSGRPSKRLPPTEGMNVQSSQCSNGEGLYR